MPMLTSEHFPASFFELSPVPLFLYYEGELSLMHRPSVCIVGTRTPDAYGERLTRLLVEKLVSHDIVIVSGFAIGIDRIAHEQALACSGHTIAVLGCGLDIDYPKTHGHLRKPMRSTGLFLSEHTAGTPPRAHHFPKRNRLMAALSEDVVIIQCLRHSGSMITARHAMELGREVWAVPGPIDQALGEGTNRLIFEGANPLIDLDEFILDIRRKHGR